MTKLNKVLPGIAWLVTWFSLSLLLDYSEIYPSEFHRGFGDSYTVYITAVGIPFFLGFFFANLLEHRLKRQEYEGKQRDLLLILLWGVCFVIEIGYQKLIWLYASDFLYRSNSYVYFFLNSGVGLLIYAVAFWLWPNRKNNISFKTHPNKKIQTEESIQNTLTGLFGKFQIVVYENSSYMRREEMSFVKERFEDHASAVEECKRIVDDFLTGHDLSTPNGIRMAHESWFACGEDPAIRPGHFSGADYLRLRCAEAYSSWRSGQQGVSEGHVQVCYPKFGIAILEVEGLPTVIAKIDHYLEKDKSIICETAVPNLGLRLIVLELALKFNESDQDLLDYMESNLLLQGWAIRRE